MVAKEHVHVCPGGGPPQSLPPGVLAEAVQAANNLDSALKQVQVFIFCLGMIWLKVARVWSWNDCCELRNFSQCILHVKLVGNGIFVAVGSAPAMKLWLWGGKISYAHNTHSIACPKSSSTSVRSFGNHTARVTGLTAISNIPCWKASRPRSRLIVDKFCLAFFDDEFGLSDDEEEGQDIYS